MNRTVLVLMMAVTVEALVEYALSIAPTAAARTLRESVKNDYTIRQKIITLTMKLDTKTVKTRK